MDTTNTSKIEELVLALLGEPRRMEGDAWAFRVPWREGKRASIRVNIRSGLWRDFEKQEGGGLR